MSLKFVNKASTASFSTSIKEKTPFKSILPTDLPLILPLLQTKPNKSPLVNSSTEPTLINKRV
jgi:hypothetical protein